MDEKIRFGWSCMLNLMLIGYRYETKPQLINAVRRYCSSARHHRLWHLKHSRQCTWFCRTKSGQHYGHYEGLWKWLIIIDHDHFSSKSEEGDVHTYMYISNIQRTQKYTAVMYKYGWALFILHVAGRLSSHWLFRELTVASCFLGEEPIIFKLSDWYINR